MRRVGLEGALRRGLLRFVHAALVGRGAGSVEAFAVGTRLARMTRELAWRDPDEARPIGYRSATAGMTSLPMISI